MQTVTYEEIVKLQGRSGVFTLPKKVREGLFEDNSLAKVTRTGNRIIIEPVKILPYSVRSYTNDEIDEFFALDDEGTKKLKDEGFI